MKKLFAFAIVLLLCYKVSAQSFTQESMQREMPEFTITGKVIDSITQKPIEFAVIALYQTKDSSLVNGTTTDINGNFNLKHKGVGNFYLKISFVGYANKIVPDILLNPRTGNFSVNIGTIMIRPSSFMLEGVAVVAEKPMIELQADKRIVNVDQILTAKGGTAIDVLENVPGVEVDDEGNVSLRGNQNVTILIDNRPVALLGDNKTILEQINADEIENIEILTNPSAKYNPEGTSGIINLKLKKQKSFGLNSMIRISGGLMNKNVQDFSNFKPLLSPLSAMLAVSYDIKKFTFNIQYSARYRKHYMRGTTYTENYNLDDLHYLNQNNYGNHGGWNQNIQGTIEWRPNNNNTLGLNASYRYRVDKDESDTWVEYSDTLKNPTQIYNIIESADDTSRNMSLALYYTHKFPKKDHKLEVNTSVYPSYSPEYSFIKRNYYESDHITPSTTHSSIWNKTYQLTDNIQGYLKIDHTYPFNDSTKLESGFESNLRKYDMDTRYYNYLFNQEQYIIDTAQSNHFLYDEFVNALYFVFNTKIRKWGLSLGLRGEMVNTNPREYNSNDNKNTYYSLYPSGALSYNISKTQQIQFIYSRRVNRPGFWYLNPHTNYSTYPYLRSGNPYLKPEYINSFELSFMQYIKKGLISPSLFYRNTTEMISDYLKPLNDTVYLTTYENFKSSSSYGLDVTFQYRLFTFWNLMFNTVFYYNIIDGSNVDASVKSESFGGFARLNNQFKFKKNWSMQWMIIYNLPSETGQGKRSSFLFSHLSVQKSWNHLDLGITVRNLFNTARFRIEYYQPSYYSLVENYHGGLSLMANISYKLTGNYKEKQQIQMLNEENGNVGNGMF
jgi:outer membrane receptor protein involved in Fe transport